MDTSESLAAHLVAVIATALPGAVQERKWNAPSFAVEGRHLITLQFPPKGHQVRVIFHRDSRAKDTSCGVTLIDDPEGRLDWPTDQRAIACFPLGAPVDDAWLAQTCRDWVAALTEETP